MRGFLVGIALVALIWAGYTFLPPLFEGNTSGTFTLEPK